MQRLIRKLALATGNNLIFDLLPHLIRALLRMSIKAPIIYLNTFTFLVAEEPECRNFNICEDKLLIVMKNLEESNILTSYNMNLLRFEALHILSHGYKFSYEQLSIITKI